VLPHGVAPRSCCATVLRHELGATPKSAVSRTGCLNGVGPTAARTSRLSSNEQAKPVLIHVRSVTLLRLCDASCDDVGRQVIGHNTTMRSHVSDHTKQPRKSTFRGCFKRSHRLRGLRRTEPRSRAHVSALNTKGNNRHSNSTASIAIFGCARLPTMDGQTGHPGMSASEAFGFSSSSDAVQRAVSGDGLWTLT